MPIMRPHVRRRDWTACQGAGGPPVCHSVGLLFLYGALDSHPFFPSHVASGRCVLSAAAAGALAGVVCAFTEPSSWCVGAVLMWHGVPFARWRNPMIGVLRMCWLPGSFAGWVAGPPTPLPPLGFNTGPTFLTEVGGGTTAVWTFFGKRFGSFREIFWEPRAISFCQCDGGTSGFHTGQPRAPPPPLFSLSAPCPPPLFSLSGPHPPPAPPVQPLSPPPPPPPRGAVSSRNAVLSGSNSSQMLQPTPPTTGPQPQHMRGWSMRPTQDTAHRPGAQAQRKLFLPKKTKFVGGSSNHVIIEGLKRTALEGHPRS